MKANVAMRTATTTLLVALAAAAHADDGPQAARVPLLPKYRQECAACHLAYPPALLPAASWARLMDNLPRHFSADASLDAASVQEIGRWLQAHAADSAGGNRRAATPPPEDRITRSAWFVREHREVRAAVWSRPSVKSASNCAACHSRAQQGDFDEHNVRVPR
jgi:Dihaem cytochrome c